MIKSYKIILVPQLLTVCISKSSNSITDISFAPGAVSDSFNIRWKERSLTVKVISVLYTAASTTLPNYIYIFSGLTYRVVAY